MRPAAQIVVFTTACSAAMTPPAAGQLDEGGHGR